MEPSGNDPLSPGTPGVFLELRPLGIRLRHEWQGGKKEVRMTYLCFASDASV